MNLEHKKKNAFTWQRESMGAHQENVLLFFRKIFRILGKSVHSKWKQKFCDGGKLSCSHFVWIHPHLFVVGCGCLLSCLFLTLRASSKEDVVYQRILQQSQENKDEAAHKVHVYGLDIGNFGEGFSQVGVNGSHGEHRGDTWCRKTIFITLWQKGCESCIKRVSIAS